MSQEQWRRQEYFRTKDSHHQHIAHSPITTVSSCISAYVELADSVVRAKLPRKQRSMILHKGICTIPSVSATHGISYFACAVH